MKTLLFLWVFIFTIFKGGLGQNLVPNPSFEDTLRCPNYISHFDDYVKNWLNPSYGSPDFFHPCCTNTDEASSPQNRVGFQEARSGIGYIGIITFLKGFSLREYVCVKLDSALNQGVRYYASFYVTLADSANYATDDIGIYFSQAPILKYQYQNQQPIKVPFHVRNLEGKILIDKKVWTRIEGVYDALGGEAYLLLGNFYDNPHTDSLLVNGGMSTGNAHCELCAYYYIDDVCVSSDYQTCGFSKPIPKDPTELRIFPNPVTDYLTIENPSDYIGAEVFVYDAVGKRCFQTTIDRTQNKIALPLAAGVYVLHLQRGKTILHHSKLLKL